MHADLLDSGLAPASVMRAHRVLSRALKVALQRGKVARNVCTLIDAPTIERVEVQPLNATEARLVLAGAAGHRNAARWSVALALGLRQGEALGLPWAALDLDAGTLAVRQALQRQQGKGLVIVAPESRAGRRTIALPEQLRDALRAHRTAQLAERLAAGSVWEDHGLVFVQPNGRPIDPRADHRAWRALLAEAGVRALGCTTPGIPPRRCSCSRVSRPASSWRSSATRRSPSRWAPTRTSPRNWLRRPHGRWVTLCGDEVAPKVAPPA